MGIYLGEKVLPGEATAWGPVTTTLFLLGGLLPGSILFLRERPPPARGAPERSPGAGLRGAAELAVPRKVICFHSVMSLRFAAVRRDGLLAAAGNADEACQSDRASISSSRQPNG